MGESDRSSSSARRIWTFGACTFDEARWALAVDGRPVEIEGKPLELLIELLRHGGDVVTKEELFDAAWPGVIVVEGSLTTAISKLRKAIGDQRGAIVATVPRVGYRINVPVSARAAQPATVKALPFAAGGEVPDRPNWRFERRLDLSIRGEVWRIRHGKTADLHVVKYASDPARLRALKREAAVSRLLARALGERDDLVPVLDWNFATMPYWLESDDGGPDLGHWVEEQGGLAAIPPPARLALAASIAATIAAAHGLGILHRDIKPANILVAAGRDGSWQARVVDFGSATLSEPERLDALGITQTGFDPDDASTTGTALWMAPELLAGGASSIASDVYALGVLLYQLVAGDLRKPLAPGWEADVADPVLRADIAAAVAGDPALRLDGAGELARRLRTIDARRSEHDALVEAAERARAAETRLERVRLRRPWVALATAALLLGVIATSLLYARAAQDRDIARHQTAIAERINQFLARDLLARSSPFRGAAEETLVDAVKQAAPLIDTRFAGEPEVAARLHQTIANALDKRSDWPGARDEYRRATALWGQAGGPGSPDVAVARLQQAMMEARSYEEGSVPRARALIAAADAGIRGRAPTRDDVPVWHASAEGMVALVDNDAHRAERAFANAVAGAERMPDFDRTARLTFRQRLAFTKIRLGDGAAAERLFRALGRDFAAIEGPDGPNVLMIGMNVAQALMIEGRHADAVAQANAVYPRLRARLGEDHEMTLQLLTTRAESEGVLERWEDAIRDDLTVHAIAVRKQGPKSFFAVATLTDAATAQCRGGHLAEGLRNAGEAHRMAREGFGKAALTDGTAYTLAACEIAAGRYDEAAGHLAGIDRRAVAELAGDPQWGANVDLALAQIAAARHRTNEARRLIQATKAVFTAAGAEPYQARAWRTLAAGLAIAVT